MSPADSTARPGPRRAYLPATRELLAEWYAAGRVPADADRVVAEDTDEESEYLALVTAADLAAALLDGPGRRVVVVVEAGDPEAEATFSEVVAVHADTADLAPADAAAEDAPDLAWYATQEVPSLLG